MRTKYTDTLRLHGSNDELQASSRSMYYPHGVAAPCAIDRGKEIVVVVTGRGAPYYSTFFNLHMTTGTCHVPDPMGLSPHDEPSLFAIRRVPRQYPHAEQEHTKRTAKCDTRNLHGGERMRLVVRLRLSGRYVGPGRENGGCRGGRACGSSCPGRSWPVPAVDVLVRGWRLENGMQGGNGLAAQSGP